MQILLIVYPLLPVLCISIPARRLAKSPPPLRNASASHLVRNCATVYPLFTTWYHRLNLLIFIVVPLFHQLSPNVVFPSHLASVHLPQLVIPMRVVVSARRSSQKLYLLRILAHLLGVHPLVLTLLFRVVLMAHGSTCTASNSSMTF